MSELVDDLVENDAMLPKVPMDTVQIDAVALPGFQLRLRNAIKAAGSREAVVRSAQVSDGTLSRFHRGGAIKRTTAQALAQALGVDLDWLLTGHQADKPADLPHVIDPATGTGAFLAEAARYQAATLASTVNFHKLGVAIELAVANYARGGATPDWGLVAVTTAMFYDSLTAPGADAAALIAKVRKSLAKE